MKVVEEKLYSIGEVCSEITNRGFKDFHAHNLRYLEKVLTGVFEVRRDEYLNRVFMDSDIDKIETVLKLKEQGLNYNAIKSFLQQNKETEVTINESVNSEEFLIENTITKEISTETECKQQAISSKDELKRFKLIMSEIVSDSIQNTIAPQLEELKGQILDLKLQNVDLKLALEKREDEHYKKIDEKLTKWREESKKTERKSWLKKLLSKM